jgi:mannose-1-phosphate guanylyltransferase
MPSSIDVPLYAVIMAGGSGTRFWPLSRQRRPKQLLPFADGRSLLAATVERLSDLVPAQRTLVVTNADVAAAARRELPQVPAENVLAEPVGRDTAACIGWVAWRLAARDPKAVMIVLPADHVIPDGSALCRALGIAATVAVGRGGLVTLGLRPTRPETGYGYIELADAVERIDELTVHAVRRFVEKPDCARAKEYVAAGNFRWNSGMFAWTVSAICSAIRMYLPKLAADLDTLIEAAGSGGERQALERLYPKLQRISIDFGVLEKASPVWAVPVDFAWSDVGSWLGLAEVVPRSVAGVSLGDVTALDCDDSVLVSDGPALAAIGVKGLVVVATRDAVLVVPKGEAQRVKELVDLLRVKGRDELL